jgi:hypothetical protein
MLRLAAFAFSVLSKVVARHFLATWTVLLVAVLWTATRVRRMPERSGRNVTVHRNTAARSAVGLVDGSSPARWPMQWSSSDAPYWAAFLVFASAYAALILFGEEFADYDNSMFTTFTLVGKNYPKLIMPEAGRFFPFGHQEFNVIRHFTRSPAGYHAFAVAELAGVVCGLMLLLCEFTVRSRLLIASLVMMTPSFFIPFSGLPFPERNVLLLLIAILVCVRRHEATGGLPWLLGSLALTHAALYYKEPLFALFLVFGVTRLWIAGASEKSGESFRQFVGTHVLEFGMCALAVLFLILYLLALGGSLNLNYAAQVRSAERSGAGAIALAYFRVDPLAATFVVAVLARGWRLWRRRELPDPLWDSLALGALAYGAAFLRLKLFSSYYWALVDLVATLYLARLARSLWPVGRAVRLGIVAAASVIVAQALAFTAFLAVEHKDLIGSRVRLAAFLQAYRSQSNEPRIDVFFPYATAYRVMELGAFLEYKGVPTDRAGRVVEPGQPPLLRLATPHPYADGQCVDYQPIACHRWTAPPSHSLIVLLPEDDVPPGAVDELAATRTALYQWRGLVSQRAAGLLARLHAVSLAFSDRSMSSHWPRLDVYRAD